MKAELKISETFRVPGSISYALLNATCKKVGVEYDNTNIARVKIFYGATKADIRYVETRLLLKLAQIKTSLSINNEKT